MVFGQYTSCKSWLILLHVLIILDNDDLEDNLDRACNMKGSWSIWGGNYAEKLMRIFGYKPAIDDESDEVPIDSPRGLGSGRKSSGRSTASPKRRKRHRAKADVRRKMAIIEQED